MCTGAQLEFKRSTSKRLGDFLSDDVTSNDAIQIIEHH